MELFYSLMHTEKKIVELSELRNMKLSTFSTALPCNGDTCKQAQKQVEVKTGGREVSSLQKRS